MDELAATPLSNIPEYTVSEISGAVKRTLEGAFGRVRVRGEITELKRFPSGHVYLSLKDEGGKLASVIWRTQISRVGLAPENGVEVIAQGKITAYGDRSTYQLSIERLEYAGVGALLARIEMLRVRLAAEGLFDPARKRAIPRLPVVIGVVTSERGAVIQDIRTTIARRFPRSILLWPVPVQGEGAAARIAEAIAGFSALPAGGAIPRPDVLIVARGGGSLEDLMAFNEEIVLRAAAACTIPLISAVGHETDTTLIDFVSDRRAPTPTAAAEMAIPVRLELLADLQHTGARLLGAMGRLAQEGRLRLQRAERGLPDLAAILGGARQRLDDRGERLARALPERVRHNARDLANLRQRLTLALPGLVATRRAALVAAERHMPAPAALTAGRANRLALAANDLRGGLRHAVSTRAALAARVTHRLSDAPLQAGLREARARLEGLSARLASVSQDAVLARGYAMVFAATGEPLTSAAAIAAGAALRLRFADGEVRATAARGDARQGALLL
jgi:exodeoxyribonuclease VII large subunit